MNQCIDLLETMYKNESNSLSLQPPRTLTRVDEDSIILTMPAYSKILGRFAVKIVTEYKKNPERFGRKVQGGVVLLMDSTTSENLALINSTALTAMRTGALSGLATRLLSRKDSRRVGVIGSGQQARTQLEAVCQVRPIEEAYVYSRDYSHAISFAKEMGERLDISVEAVQEKKELKGHRGDILIVATNSSLPVLSWDEDISPGMHINSIGTLPERQELDLDTISNSRLYVDTKDGVLREAGDVIYAIRSRLINQNRIQGDLSDVILGKTVGRRNPSDVTLFKSVGFAMLDVYAANAVFENTMRLKEK
jgi:alanine dehydrogenase